MKEKITRFYKIFIMFFSISVSLLIKSYGSLDKTVLCPPGVAIKITADYDILCLNQKGKIFLKGAKNGYICWYKSSNGNNWKEINNEHDSVLIIGPLQKSTYYKAKVSFCYGYYCYVLYSNVIKITYKNVSAPSLSFIVDSVNCPGGNDGSIDLIVSSGTYPYNYYWSNGATTEDIVNLSAGNYSVTVIDNNQCREVGNTIVHEKDYIPLEPGNISGGDNLLHCYNYDPGILEINPTGGNGNYTYQWQFSLDKLNWQNIINGNT